MAKHRNKNSKKYTTDLLLDFLLYVDKNVSTLSWSINSSSPGLDAFALVPALHFLTHPNRASTEMQTLPFS